MITGSSTKRDWRTGSQPISGAYSHCTDQVTIAVGQIARNAGLLLAIIGFMYAAVCLVLFAMQRSMIYYPQPGAAQSPDTTLNFPVHGATLHLSVRTHASPEALIYFG